MRHGTQAFLLPTWLFSVYIIHTDNIGMIISISHHTDILQTDIIKPRNAAIEQGLLNKQKEPFGVRRKDFWEANIHWTFKLLSPAFQDKLCHEPDGLIFQPEPDVRTALSSLLPLSGQGDRPQAAYIIIIVTV